MKVVTADQMREIEARAAKTGLTSPVLMENAGLAFAGEVRKYLGQPTGMKLLFLIGPGNNGGDGLVAARHLHDWGAEVTVYLCVRRAPQDKNLELVVEREVPVVNGEEDNGLSSFQEALATANAVIDALFGTGKMRALAGIFKDTVHKMMEARKKQAGLRVIALDLPSGLNPDDGTIDPACPAADLTVTLSSPKVGLYLFPGAGRAGKVVIADIGIPDALTDDVSVSLITPEWVGRKLPLRPLNANKGTFGKLMVVAGSVNYVGAAYLACQAAYRVGTGLVTLATAESLVPVLAGKLTETTYEPLPEKEKGHISAGAVGAFSKAIPGYSALLIGCGIGQNPGTKEFIRTILLSRTAPLPEKVVVDADALNILAQASGWQIRLTGSAIFTPHPGEMSRLTGQSVEKIQSDRINVARLTAREWGNTVVLKGAFTVIATPDGQVMLSDVAEPALASAGTGDVLAGMIGGLLAQGMDHLGAAAAGVYMHGAAALAVAERMGHAGVLASDLLPEIPLVRQRLTQAQQF